MREIGERLKRCTDAFGNISMAKSKETAALDLILLRTSTHVKWLLEKKSIKYLAVV
jgi:hypothetical protein